MSERAAELVMIRHAPAETAGRLCGRTDVAALRDGMGAVGKLRLAVSGTARRVSSPALRCRQTAATLWPGEEIETDGRLVEQDFGDWDGMPLTEVPDLGPMAAADLARHRPPGGESFEELCARVRPALMALAEEAGSVAVVAHAGTVRAALALALGASAPALTFEIAPLSVTRLRRYAGGFSVICTNCAPG